MEYKYYNKFNLSEQLSQAISTIISEKENDYYVCKILKLSVPKHEDIIFQSPLTNADICGQGCSALNGAQIQEINKKYGKYIEGTIPEADYYYLVVMKDEYYKKISKLSFKSRDAIDGALQFSTIFAQKYDGIFDSRTLSGELPYLQDFFTSIDDWRAQTGRVTIDDNVLNESTKKTLCKRKTL